MSSAKRVTNRIALSSALFTIGVALTSIHASAKADESPAVCSAIGTRAAVGGYRVVDSQELTRVQARPYNILPRGVALLVSAPRGTNEADLQRDLEGCRARSEGLAAHSDAISVERSGSQYVVKLTAKSRDDARTLARSAR